MRNLLAAFCIIVIWAFSCGIVDCYSETLELGVGESESQVLRLNEGDEVSGRITVIGGPIDFSISGPQGKLVQKYTGIATKNFKFSAQNSGTYTFLFESQALEETTHITLNYNVQHFIFGLPQEQVILLAIVGLALVAVVVFAAMSPKH